MEKGYRVARVEQTETPEGMKEHNRTCGKGQKVSQSVTGGVTGLTFGFGG